MNYQLENILKREPFVHKPFFLMAGPCVLEDEIMGFEIAKKITGITTRLNIPYIFKASYKKANRSKLESFTGIGDTVALNVLGAIGKEYGIPVVTDIHSQEEAFLAAQFVDVLQIPAFLCRQTELLLAAAKTGKAVNVKKGQFLSPHAMEFAIEKIRSAGNQNIMVTERGTTFGYSDLVVDFRGVPVMQGFGVPVVLDVTHSLQQPNQAGGVTGGLPHLIETIAKAGIAAGVDGIFIETHPEPAKAKSDGANMLKLENLEQLLERLIRVREAVSGY
ncbi:MAG TPA: 3-deoxy-8-phosphooctulonate synthase [Bacteroidales bacterium]|nr:3-deoxy-8-phosphooctulonate synthase [Bacteroidales bacterium]